MRKFIGYIDTGNLDKYKVESFTSVLGPILSTNQGKI